MTQDARLDDLAVLYLGLAHGIDHRMHFNQFTRIAAQLERWRHPGDRRDIVKLVDDIVREHDAIRVIAAVENLRRSLSDREKRAVLEELSEIALADRRFLKVEAEYIGRVAYDWELQPAPDDQGAFWTVIRARNAEAARAAASSPGVGKRRCVRQVRQSWVSGPSVGSKAPSVASARRRE